MANTPDISIENHFSLFLLNTQEGSDWVADNVQPDAHFFGHALVVESRYAHDLVEGMIRSGLVVR
jgi:hypothetical protein